MTEKREADRENSKPAKPRRVARAPRSLLAIEDRIAEASPELIDVVINAARRDSRLALELLKLFIV